MDYWINITIAQKILKLFSDCNVIASFAGHTHRSDISVLNGTTYYTTVEEIMIHNGSAKNPFLPQDLEHRSFK